ncbi:hypothetical protein AQY21_07165 [Paracoccus sp. MKU1]|nr:hypothetical protein AQY21_07165 [Paracoccus sp. MKU1]
MAREATAFLDWFTTNKLLKGGSINLTHALTEAGTTRTEYTVVRQAGDDYSLISAGAWADYDGDHLRKLAEEMEGALGQVIVRGITTQWGVFAIAGPDSRAILKELVRDADPETVLGNKRFPWLSMRNIELGWELHRVRPLPLGPADRGGLKLVGARAQNWLRQEKSHRAFGSELGRDATPLEAALDRFADLDKAFNGKQAMLDKGVCSKCCTLLIDGQSDADPWVRETPLTEDGSTKIDRLTSGGWPAAFCKSIGMGYIRPDLAEPGTRLKVRMQRQLWDAVVTEDNPYDPENKVIRVDG